MEKYFLAPFLTLFTENQLKKFPLFRKLQYVTGEIFSQLKSDFSLQSRKKENVF
jgi:hypothetical protein